jgi:hypothetical protein
MGIEEAPDLVQVQWEEMSADPVGQKALEEASLEYLKTKDREYFDQDFTGELDSQGYLVRRDGGPPNTKPSQHIVGGMKEVIEMAKSKLDN